MSIASDILVVVDPDQGFEQPSIQRALLLARKSQAGLVLFSCHLDRGYLHTQIFGGLDVEKARALQLKQIESGLEGHASRLKDESISCSVAVISSLSLASAITRQIEATNPSIVIKETRYHRKIARAFLSHTDWDLIRECPVPLWLVKAGNDVSHESGIVACIDPSHPDEQHAKADQSIIEIARELGACMGANVSYFHALAPLADYAKPFVMDEIVENAREEQRVAISRYLDTYGIAEEQLHVVEGFPEHTLSLLVEAERFGVVVIGAISRHGPQRILIGSTAERLLDAVSCDVLVVRP